MGEQHKQTMRRFYDEITNGGNLDLIDELLTEDFAEHEEFPGISPGRDGVKQFFATWRAAFPDTRFTVDDLIAEGDKVVARCTVTGTHQGEWMGLPPTGKQITMQVVDIVRFREDGKATEHWGVSDAMGMMQQLGAVPTPEGAPAA